MITGVVTLLGDPAGDLHAFGHRRGADIGHAGIAADHAAGADEQRLAAGAFHDARQRRGRRMHDRQHLALAMDQLLQARRGAWHAVHGVLDPLLRF